ncbi:MAG: 30S ribosomal protein S20 [Tissierellia bacterium]|nr:30S ribosomal protein S20 [Tissierellia bacterium]
MANIKSAIKRIDVTKRQTARNKAKKSEIKTYIKKFESSINEKDFDKAEEYLKLVDKKMKKAAQKNVIHSNRVASKVSKMAKELNKARA